MSESKLLFDLQKRLLANQMNTWRQHSLLENRGGVVVRCGFFYCNFCHVLPRVALFSEFYIPRDFFEMILEYLLSLLYFVPCCVMLTFSSTIICLARYLFHARETSYLMTCPLSPAAIFFL